MFFIWFFWLLSNFLQFIRMCFTFTVDLSRSMEYGVAFLTMTCTGTWVQQPLGYEKVNMQNMCSCMQGNNLDLLMRRSFYIPWQYLKESQGEVMFTPDTCSPWSHQLHPVQLVVGRECFLVIYTYLVQYMHKLLRLNSHHVP